MELGPFLAGVIGLALWLIGPIRIWGAFTWVALMLGKAARVTPGTVLRLLGAAASTTFTLMGVLGSALAIAAVVPEPLGLAIRTVTFLAFLPLGIGTFWACSRYLKRREALIESDDAWALDLIRVVAAPFAGVVTLWIVYTIGLGISALDSSPVARHHDAWARIFVATMVTVAALAARRVWRGRHFVRVDDAIVRVEAGRVGVSEAGAAFARAEAVRDHVSIWRGTRFEVKQALLAPRQDDVVSSAWVGVGLGALGFLGVHVADAAVHPVPHAGIIGFALLLAVPIAFVYRTNRRIWREDGEWAEAAAQAYVPDDYSR